MDLVHVTLAGNTVTGEGPGIWISQVAGVPTVQLTNTLLSAKTGPGGLPLEMVSTSITSMSDLLASP